MGGNQSNLPPRPLGFEYMSIAVRETDKFRVILGTDREISIIRQVIQESWPKGIQQETFKMNGVHEFKFKGNPFCVATSSSDAIISRKMAGNVLHRLYHDGWKLQMSSDLTQTTDLTTWIFKKDTAAICPSLPFLIVGLSSFDSLMVLNGPMDLHHLFKDVMEKSWPQGIQRWTYENDVLMIKLKGNPWYANGEDTVHARVILHTLIGALQVKQWKLYANSNLRSSANTLFFEYDPNIVPGMQFSPMPGMQLSQSHFTVSLNSHDLLRLIGAPEGLVSAVRTTLQTFWSRGIQEERAYATSWQFKLRGNPWWASGDEAVDSRFLVLKILEALQAYGWSVAASIDCSRKDSDKSSVIFKTSQPTQSHFFCVSLHETDKLRLINAPEDVTKICQDVIQSQYLLGIQRVQIYGKSLEFKFVGNPWSCGIDGHDGIHGRSMLLHIFAALASRFWRPVMSADVSAKYVHQKDGPDYPLDVDSIFFTYDPTAASLSAPSYMQPSPYGFLPPNQPPPPFAPPAYGVYPNQH